MTSADNPENTVLTSSARSTTTDRDTSAQSATTESATEPLFLQSPPSCHRGVPGDCAANGVSGPTRRAEVRRDGHCE
jgi:hypothetical protein